MSEYDVTSKRYRSYVAGEQLITPSEGSAHVPSLPSSIVDRSTREDSVIMFYTKFVYANSDSGLLFIMYDHCSPVVV